MSEDGDIEKRHVLLVLEGILDLLDGRDARVIPGRLKVYSCLLELFTDFGSAPSVRTHRLNEFWHTSRSYRLDEFWHTSRTRLNKCAERMALGLGVTSYGLKSYDSLFFNVHQSLYISNI